MTSNARGSHRPEAVALLFWLSAVALGTAACGAGAESAPKAPGMIRERSKDERPEPKTVEEAQEQIAQARADLEGLAKKTPADSSTRPAEPAAPSAETSGQGGASAREERAEDVCSSPCRALASMRRAVEALCRMTGDTDNRCVDAKRTLTESITRVASCKCEGR